MTDLVRRLDNRVQISSDALAAYVDATERAFGADVDYGRIIRYYEAEPIGAGRYLPDPGSVQGVEPDQWGLISAKRRRFTKAPGPQNLYSTFGER